MDSALVSLVHSPTMMPHKVFADPTSLALAHDNSKFIIKSWNAMKKLNIGEFLCKFYGYRPLYSLPTALVDSL